MIAEKRSTFISSCIYSCICSCICICDCLGQLQLLIPICECRVWPASQVELDTLVNSLPPLCAVRARYQASRAISRLETCLRFESTLLRGEL